MYGKENIDEIFIENINIYEIFYVYFLVIL